MVPAHVDNAIGALYELGVITGTNNRVGRGGRFEPFALVTRAQMASIVMRALGHTDLRPAGVIAQSTVDSTQVSARDEDFAPVMDARIEVIASDYADVAFDDDGECVTDRFIIRVSTGSAPCRIDFRDELTEVNGNATFDVGTGRRNPFVIAGGNGVSYTVNRVSRDPAARFTLWVWSGEVGDTVDDETELIEPASANTVRPRLPAVEAVIAGGSSTHVRMGSSVTYTVQLVDEDGDPVGPPGGGEDGFIGVVSKIRQSIDSVSGAPIEDDPDTFPDEAFESAVEIERVNLPELLVPDSGGRFTVTVTHPDRNAGVNDPDVGVRVTLEPVPGNDLKIVDITTPIGTVNRPPGASSVVTSWDSAYVRFSDDDRRAAVATLETTPWSLLEPGLPSGHSIRIVVVDQYGGAFRNSARSYYVTASATGDEEGFAMNSD